MTTTQTTKKKAGVKSNTMGGTTKSTSSATTSKHDKTATPAKVAPQKTGKKGQHAVCPRCREKKIAEVSRSPVAGIWTVYGCETCLYVWRDTETEAYTDPDQYPEAFRIDPKSLSTLGDMPNIPALRAKSAPTKEEKTSKSDASSSKADAATNKPAKTSAKTTPAKEASSKKQ